MLEYNGVQLIKYRAKTAGKNKSETDGFYVEKLAGNFGQLQEKLAKKGELGNLLKQLKEKGQEPKKFLESLGQNDPELNTLLQPLQQEGTLDTFLQCLEQQRKWFIKKPDDKRELFIEGLIGRFYTKLKQEGLIEDKYHRSFICADFIPCDEGGFALIQPCEEFEELFRCIGTGYRDGSDRDTLYEMVAGPRLYPLLTQQGEGNYFGLSFVLLLSLLVGNYSVHSGNIVILKKSNIYTDEGKEVKQFAGIDYGAAGRDFAHPDNNSNILVPREYTKGTLNLAWLTKGYITNYRNIHGLLSSMANHARMLQDKLPFEKVAEIFREIFAGIPAELRDEQSIDDLAQYMSIKFDGEDLSPEDKYGQLTTTFINTLSSRLEKLTHLQETNNSASIQPTSMYASYVVDAKSTLDASSVAASFVDLGPKSSTPATIEVDPGMSFPELLESWSTTLAQSAQQPDLSKVNLELLIQQFNHYVGITAHQAELHALWDPKDNCNQFVDFYEGDNNAKMGWAFVPQYRESTILRQMYTYHNLKEASRIVPYEQPRDRYLSKYPDSAWAKIESTLTAGRTVITSLQESLANKIPIDLEKTKSQLSEFVNSETALRDHFKKHSKDELEFPEFGSHFFYPISDDELQKMSPHQLVTICLEELYSSEPSPLVERIVSNEALWKRVGNGSLQADFAQRADDPAKKILRLYLIRAEIKETIYLEEEKAFQSAPNTGDKIAANSRLQDAFKNLPANLQTQYRNSAADYAKEANYLQRYEQYINLPTLSQRLSYDVGFTALRTAFDALPDAVKIPYQKAFNQLSEDNQLYQGLQQYIATDISIQTIAATMQRLEPSDNNRGTTETATQLREAVLRDHFLWNAMASSSTSEKLPHEVRQDLLILKNFRDMQVSKPDTDIKFVNEVNLFYESALAIRLSDKPIKEQAEGIKAAAHRNFTHRQETQRFVADVVVLLSTLFFGLGLIILGGRWLAGYTPFFHKAATAREEAVTNLLVDL